MLQSGWSTDAGQLAQIADGGRQSSHECLARFTFIQVSSKCRPQARFEVVIGVGGRVIDHVIAVEFTVLEKSFYGDRHGIRPVLV